MEQPTGTGRRRRRRRGRGGGIVVGAAATDEAARSGNGASVAVVAARGTRREAGDTRTLSGAAAASSRAPVADAVTPPAPPTQTAATAAPSVPCAASGSGTTLHSAGSATGGASAQLQPAVSAAGSGAGASAGSGDGRPAVGSRAGAGAGAGANAGAGAAANAGAGADASAGAAAVRCCLGCTAPGFGEWRPEGAAGSAAIVGRCTAMCSAAELRERTAHHELTPCELAFTTTTGTGEGGGGVRGQYLAVAQYRRSAAGVVFAPQDVRTRATLVSVVRHLLVNVAQLAGVRGVGFAEKYGFISDRLRGVRQELTVQGCRGDDVIRVYECMTRFHVASRYRITQEPGANVSSALNEQSLSACLTALLEMYGEKRAALRLGPAPASPSEAEMWSYAVLHHAASEDLAALLRGIPPLVAACTTVVAAVTTVGCWAGKRWVAFLRAVRRDLTVPQRCLVHSLVSRARYRLFLALRHGTNVRHAPPPAVDTHMRYASSDLARMGEFDSPLCACRSARAFGCGVEGVPGPDDPAEGDASAAGATVQFKPPRGKARMDGVASEDDFVRAAADSRSGFGADDGLILAADTAHHHAQPCANAGAGATRAVGGASDRSADDGSRAAGVCTCGGDGGGVGGVVQRARAPVAEHVTGGDWWTREVQRGACGCARASDA